MQALRIAHSAVVDGWRERERVLGRRGIRVRTLSARRWNEGGAEVSLESRPTEDVFGVRTFGSHPALFVYDPRPLWRELGRNWDVIEIHEEPFALSTAEILLIRRLRRQRAPYTLYSAQNIDKRFPFPFNVLERHALRGAGGISVCNGEAGRIVEAKGFPGVASVIPLGTDLSSFRPEPSRDRMPRSVIRVGYAGRLEPHKGVDVLLDSLVRDDRLELSIAGAGPQEGELRHRVQSQGLRERVRFLGPIRPENLPHFYRSLDVLAVPSLTTSSWVEQFGRVAVEAQACGTPVVVSDSGALPEVVGDAGVIVPAGDAARLGDALARVGRDPALAGELRRAGLARARRTGWEHVADLYEALYARASGSGSAPPAETRALEVIVVAFGSPDLLRRALEPIAGEWPLTVVDNSSAESVRTVCSELGVRYLDPGVNGGFARGVNFGLRHRVLPEADLLLLNPDALISVRDVRELHRGLLVDPRLASVGPSQVDEAGRPARVAWPFPTPWRAMGDAVGLGRLHEPDQFVIGSVLLLRREALEQVGPFDESFFLYAEETDLGQEGFGAWLAASCRQHRHHTLALGRRRTR